MCHKKETEHQNKERDSGLELLRLFCILLIIAHHYAVHGGYPAVGWQGIIGTHAVLFIQELSMFGRAACSIFALISGYFLIHADVSNHRRHYRKMLPLVIEMFFYSVLLWLVMAWRGVAPFTFRAGLRALLPVLTGNWYVVYYLVIFALLPFLNPYLQSLSRKQYTGLLGILYLIWSVIPTVTHFPTALKIAVFADNWWYGNLDFFVILYLTGAYIGRFLQEQRSAEQQRQYPNSLNALVMAVSIAVMVLSVWGFDAAGIALRSSNLVQNANYLMAYNSVPAVCFAVSAFLFFRRLHFKSRLINKMAGSVLGIYLIHDNEYVRDFIWTIWLPNRDYLQKPYMHAAMKILVVFGACLLIDLIQRATIGRLVKHLMRKLSDRDQKAQD